MTDLEGYPALQVIDGFETHAQSVRSAVANHLVHGLVQAPDYYRGEVAPAASEPSASETDKRIAQRGVRQEKYFDAGDKRGHLSMIVSERALRTALQYPGQREMLTRRRDSGLLTVSVLPDDVIERSVSVYSNESQGAFAAYREPELGQLSPGKNGSIATEEGQRFVEAAKADVWELASIARNATFDF